MTSQPKYPDIHVELVGHDGNAFAILGRMRRGLQRGGVPADEIKAFMDEAMSSDYDHLLATCCRWAVVS